MRGDLWASGNHETSTSNEVAHSLVPSARPAARHAQSPGRPPLTWAFAFPGRSERLMKHSYYGDAVQWGERGW